MNRSYYLFFLLAMLALQACHKVQLNERISLWRNDKIPYGTYFSFQSLPFVFPKAKVLINTKSPDRYNFSTSKSKGVSIYDNQTPGKSGYLIISPLMRPDEREVQSLIGFLSEGNHVFISSFDIGKRLLDSLRLKMGNDGPDDEEEDSLMVSIRDPLNEQETEYSYPGKALDNYFASYDSSITTVLGYNSHGKPNFVKFTYEGGGTIYLHLAPMAFTNFFLLFSENNTYYNKAMSFLPSTLDYVYWDDYYRYHVNGKDRASSGRNQSFSKLHVFLNDEILRWPLWITIALFALIYLFESKRKQRVIPIKKPLKNTSLEFVRTIGQLYYQQRNNKDLAMKMTAHFLDNIRRRFNISTSSLDETFIKRLTYKSGYDRTAISNILYQMKFLQDQNEVDDGQLLDFHSKLEHFYKTT